ncbi:MAG: hypothetical protein AAGA03_12015 [Planctomycetota bacterium]
MFRASLIILALVCLANTASAAELVRYRCPEWKTKHIHDSKKAKTISETLVKLKCEVKRNAHNGHEDLRYRCKDWTELSLKSHKEALKWEEWLKAYGFQTEHKH